MALADNIWWTRKTRIQSEKRLLSNAFQSQLLLLWYSFFGVAVSIYYLSSPTVSDSNIAQVSWVVFSVLILVMSGFVSGLSFKERASLIKQSYEAMDTLYHKACMSDADIEEISKSYKNLLDQSENHIDLDYYLALCSEYLKSDKPIDETTGLKEKFDRKPIWFHYTLLSFLLFRRYLMLLLLYNFPIIIVIVLNYFS